MLRVQSWSTRPIRIFVAASVLFVGAANAEIRSLPVPSLTIYPGETITAAMLTEKKFAGSAQSLNAAVTSAGAIIGMTAKRTLLPGRLIPPNAVKPADLVKQGALTAAVFRSAGLTISTYAVALRSGVEGDIIEARNPETGVVLRAVVQADGTLLVSAP
jgi:flagella basal body P-ring formation protein FlgA